MSYRIWSSPLETRSPERSVKSKTQDRDAVGAKVFSVTQQNGHRSSKLGCGQERDRAAGDELLGESLCCLPNLTIQNSGRGKCTDGQTSFQVWLPQWRHDATCRIVRRLN